MSPRLTPSFTTPAWDIWRTLDYLQSRPDVAPDRIGMFGTSKGGIETWLAAAVDERVKVAVPAIGVQSFRWSLEHDRWQARAKTIQEAHEAVAKDLGEAAVNARVAGSFGTRSFPASSTSSMVRACSDSSPADRS